MALTLEIISRQRAALGERARCLFDRRGGNIGRSLECDWILPDAQRFVSSRHAAVDFRGGSYYLVDLSTNGVYVNDADAPVGRGRPQRLFSGDRLRMGEYLMVVHIEADDELAAVLAEDAENPLGEVERVEAPAPPASELINEFELTGALDLHLEQEETPPSFRPGSTQPLDASTGRRRAPTAADRRAQFAVVDGGAGGATPPARRKPAGPPAGSANDDDALLSVFLRAAGLEGDANLAALDARGVMHTLGLLLRETVVGVTEALHERGRQRETMKLPSTTIQPRNNNPLKFSGSVQEALARVLADGSPEFLPPVESLREAFRDIKEHQAATLTAARQAFLEFVEHLDPSELEQRFEAGARRKALLPGSAKARNWEQYAELYEVLTRHAPGQLPQLFSEEFARAYTDALEALQATRRRA